MITPASPNRIYDPVPRTYNCNLTLSGLNIRIINGMIQQLIQAPIIQSNSIIGY